MLQEHEFLGKRVRAELKVKFHNERAWVVIVEIENRWDYLVGKSWRESTDNPIALLYAVRVIEAEGDLPEDDEVYYCKLDGFGHLIHRSEIVDIE